MIPRILSGVAAGAWLLAAPVPLVAATPAQHPPSLKEKVLQDVTASTEPRARMSKLFAYYVVPAMSNLKRIQDTHPEDGTLGGPVRILAAQGEFEPASVVFFAFKDAEKVELKVSDLTGKNGRIPASAIDVKVVKVWYQTGLAWHSYFADTKGRQLTPELLLNDETLIRVDRDTRDNYLRVDHPEPRGSDYVWISNPHQIEIPFNDHLEPVADAPNLRPFSLHAGEFKQIWLTFEAPGDAEGFFTGSITVTVDGTPQGAIPLEVRVLPFSLPDPKTNYDLERDYYTSMYNEAYLPRYLAKNGGNTEKALKRLANEYQNMRKHNLLHPMLPELNATGGEEVFLAQLEAYKKAGLRTDTIFGAIPAAPRYDWMTSPDVQNKRIGEQPAPHDLLRRIDRAHDAVTKAFGQTTVYCFGWDEPAQRLIRAQRLPWKYVHEKGLRVFSTGHTAHLTLAGYNEDFLNYGGKYSRESADIWHAIGGRMTSYAAPHTGPENPDFTRRTHGFDLYMANCDGTNNYMWNGSPWNDFAGAEHNFRAFNMVYPGREKPIDTLQWEGFREGIDDVRYATLLKQLANQAIATGKTEKVYAGRKALLWLATQDSKTCDLNTLRLEMIARILQLRATLHA